MIQTLNLFIAISTKKEEKNKNIKQKTLSLTIISTHEKSHNIETYIELKASIVFSQKQEGNKYLPQRKLLCLQVYSTSFNRLR